MKNLLLKEVRLCLHPTNFLFLALSAMMLIPAYPLYVTFFYTCLGVFFLCLTGRENHDITYSLLLPIRKRDIVRARILTVSLLQLVQLAIAVPFTVLRGKINPPENIVGMDANLALIGLSAVMFALFNIAFFPRYYANVDRVGVPFLLGCTAIVVFMLAAETCAHVVPFVRDQLDTPDPMFIGAKFAVLAIGLALFAGLNVLTYKISADRFEKVDL